MEQTKRSFKCWASHLVKDKVPEFSTKFVELRQKQKRFSFWILPSLLLPDCDNSFQAPTRMARIRQTHHHLGLIFFSIRINPQKASLRVKNACAELALQPQDRFPPPTPPNPTRRTSFPIQSPCFRPFSLLVDAYKNSIELHNTWEETHHQPPSTPPELPSHPLLP